MKKYLTQLHHAMSILRQRLTNDNMKARLILAAKVEKELQIFDDEFGERVAEAQKIEAGRIRVAMAKTKTTDPIHEQKAGLLKTMSEVGHSLVRMNFDLRVSSLSLKEGFNGCTEHATLMFLILNKEFLFDSDVLIESICVYDKLNPMINHNFLVINRRSGDYPLTDVAAWGDDCLVIDTWLGVIAAPGEMPTGSSVYAFLQGKDFCTMEVIYSNRLGRELCVYPENHLFHKIERDTQQVMQAEFKKIIDKYIDVLDLPWLKSTPTAMAGSRALSRHGLFPSSSDADLKEPHEQLYNEIKQHCAGKYQPVLEAVEGKQYALALRKVSAIGQIELLNILLSYKDLLGFDINEPSKSNGKTAFDWAAECDSTEAMALIEKHGGKSGFVENLSPKIGQ
ncbi:hypothetical protein J2N86_03665 [Legionella lytica]|uniref:Ankyrin repeat-containing protein n=1 Tax=Legionella lytica TaxID=96232 RepID=A0ABY4YAE0_9GAMM|nr:hypothetical protein [Legionella lytica]USQ14432.1 hypothetical protein J2N86_03665 [Legionella lytica]